MKSASKILRKRYGLKKQEKRGKWQRDPWLRILELLSKMTHEERQRCIRATAAFYHGR